MKKVIKIILILLLIPASLIMIMVGNIWYQKNRSYNQIYESKSDKSLAQVIENSINLISNSKPLDTFIEEYKKPSIKDLKRYNLDLTLNDIAYVCYSESVYGVSAPEMLDNIGIKYKHAYLIEYKKQVGYGEGSSLFMFVKTNGNIIPIFVSAYFYDINTNLKFQTGCVKTNNNQLNIKINSSLKEKALIILE